MCFGAPFNNRSEYSYEDQSNRFSRRLRSRQFRFCPNGFLTEPAAARPGVGFLTEPAAARPGVGFLAEPAAARPGVGFLAEPAAAPVLVN
jgi:hypothetical protein